jgi:hypothetical protein
MPNFNISCRCIATLAGNFPFALGAATFGNFVFEDRLLNVSSDKTVRALDTSFSTHLSTFPLLLSHFSSQAEGEVGDRMFGKIRVFAFGDGLSGCCGTLSILQTHPESLQTLCRDESGRYVTFGAEVLETNYCCIGTLGNGLCIHQ